MKKIYIMLLAVIMLSLAAMPAYADVYVTGTGYNNDFTLQDGAIRYIKDEKKLILNGVNIETTNGYPIMSDDGDIKEIELIGENTITVISQRYYGLYFGGADVRIYGSGSLKSTASYTPLCIPNGSLTIDGADVEIVHTDITSSVSSGGDIILTNGARLKITKQSKRDSAVSAKNGIGKIEISENSRLVIDTCMEQALYGGMFDAEYVKLSDTSGIEIVSPTDSRPAEDVYNASDIYLVNKADNQYKNIFSIDRFTSAKNNRFTVTQAEEEDGRYKLVIQGEEVDVPVIIVPETGDSSTPLLWLALTLTSMIGMTVVFRRRKA